MKRVSSLLGSFLLAFLVLVLPSQVFAATSSSSASVVSSTLSEGSGVLYTPIWYTKPNAPVMFKLKLNKHVLSVLGLKFAKGILVDSNSNKRSSFGVLLVQGSNYTLATLDNGMLSMSHTKHTITVRAEHANFKRYSAYSAYLLTGSRYQQVSAVLDTPTVSLSKGVNLTTVTPNYFNTSSGANLSGVTGVLGLYMHTLQTKGLVDGFTFNTGSSIGEATHVSYTLSSQVIGLNSNGNLNFIITDDYGDPATNASIHVRGLKKNSASVASGFSAPSTTPITDGTASLLVSDSNAESINMSYSVTDNTFTDRVDTITGSISEKFVH